MAPSTVIGMDSSAAREDQSFGSSSRVGLGNRTVLDRSMVSDTGDRLDSSGRAESVAPTAVLPSWPGSGTRIARDHKRLRWSRSILLEKSRSCQTTGLNPCAGSPGNRRRLAPDFRAGTGMTRSWYE